ncbi:MAG TPA: hypothetical protein VGE67_11020, partial [Haloferula sp.]
ESAARDIVAQFDLSVELERRERLGMDYEDDGQNVDVSYEMCWGIAFAGFPSLVLERCERQFEGSQSGHEIETLGLLRALSGDRAGAAAAFNASLRMAYCSLANDVKESWVAQLRENQNPFTKEVIEELKKQEPDERVLLGE